MVLIDTFLNNLQYTWSTPSTTEGSKGGGWEPLIYMNVTVLLFENWRLIHMKDLDVTYVSKFMILDHNWQNQNR